MWALWYISLLLVLAENREYYVNISECYSVLLAEGIGSVFPTLVGEGLHWGVMP